MVASFMEFLATLRIQDVLDILLNSYLIFRLYYLLRGTRLLRIAAVIAFLLFLQRVVSASGMIITQTVREEKEKSRLPRLNFLAFSADWTR